MRKFKEILRLHSSCLSQRTIATSLSISVGVVNKYIEFIRRLALIWPLPESLNEADLQAQLSQLKQQMKVVPEPSESELPPYAAIDYALIHQELKRRHVTLQLLWEEYCERNEGRLCYSYSQFCRRYRAFAACQSPSMRQTHQAGDKLFIDYAGRTVPIVNRVTGEINHAEIFIAVLGASNYTYAEATWTQSLPDWIGSHVRAFRFFGGVPALLVPDNLKSATHKACRYEPDINPSYAECIRHYDTAVLPARPYKPKDKAKVEGGVLIVSRWILARLRNRQFFSLDELNRAIQGLLKSLNERPFKKLPGSRLSQFTEWEQGTLKALPEDEYEFAEHKLARVNMDYHVEIDRHYYSVPYRLLRQQVDVRITAKVIEISHQGERVAVHARNPRVGAHTTLDTHMPKAHQHMGGWTPGKFLNQAKKIGDQTSHLVQYILDNKKHPEQGYRVCLGLLRLEKRFGTARLEAACALAIQIGSPHRKSVLSILEKKLDQHTLPNDQEDTSQLPEHHNIRGANYYKTQKDIPLC